MCKKGFENVSQDATLGEENCFDILFNVYKEDSIAQLQILLR